MNQKKDLEAAIHIPVKEEVILAPYSTLKVGGPADYFVEVRSKDEFSRALSAAHQLQVPYTVFGGGSNVLIGDKGVRGLVIRNLSKEISVRGMKGKYGQGIPEGTVYVEADAGVLVNSFVRFTIEEGLGGIEAHLGLPGTVGGGLYMNSKWMHPESYLGDALFQATIFTPTGEFQLMPKSYFQFGYDTSILQKTREVLISATFALTRSSPDVLWQTANESIAYRRKSQPQGVSSLGCTFRNIAPSQAILIPTPGQTTSAGYLIDHAGLKGYTIGKARVSDLHANFIVNTGGATAADIVRLIEHIRSEVKKKFGVTLVEEIVKVGEF